MSQRPAQTQTPTIEIQPTHTIQTPFDRDNLVLFKIPDEMRGQIELGTDKLIIAIRNIFTSKISIDHLEYFCWNVSDGIMFALGGYSPKVQEQTQSRIDGVAADADDLPEPLATVYQKLDGKLPDSLNLKIGSLPFGMFGPRAAVTSRAVINAKNQKITNSEKCSDGGLKRLFSELKDKRWLYSCTIRRTGKLPESFEFQLTPRVAVFHPEYRISSESDYLRTIEFGRQLDPIDAFGDIGITSSLARIDEQYGISSLGTGGLSPRSSSPFGFFDTEHPRITGDEEYEHIIHGRYGASDKLEEISSYTSIMARERDLGLFVALGTTVSNGDPWGDSVVGTALDDTDLATDLSEISPDPVSIPVEPTADADVATASPSTANDGKKLHWDAIKQTALALKNDGYEVIIVEQDTGSRPDLWVRRDNGEIFAVEVESTTQSKAASVFTNLIRQALWGYKTIMVMVPQTNEEGRTQSLHAVGRWAVNKLAKPMKELNEYKTKLHNLGENINKAGMTILLPEGVTESEWWLTCENRYLLLHKGTVLAEGDATEPFEEFEFYTPRYYEEDGTYIVEDDDGTRLQICDSEDDIRYTRASPCHRAVDLSYLHFVEALYCYDPSEEELVQHDIVANWDQPDNSARHEASHEDAFSTFVVNREQDRLWERECWPFIRDWIGVLSDHGTLSKNVYGRYRKNYYPRKANNDDVGKRHFYPNASFRYQRGLVCPDLPGLSTTPSFPDDWDVDPDEVLREPLIYGLSDRDEVLERVADSEPSV